MVLIILIATFLRLHQLPTLPPGLNFDEAGNGVAALDILHGAPKLWWRIGGGKEPLWPYLIALSTAVLGNASLALRFPAAIVGILSVAAVYPLTYLLFRQAGRSQAQMIALLAMLGLALSEWHLHFSRLGFRAILLPLLSTLGFYFFWRGLVSYQLSVVSGQWSEVNGNRSLLTAYRSPITAFWSLLTGYWSLVGAALFIALAIYAYLAARLLPLVLILFFFIQWFIYRLHSKSKLRKSQAKQSIRSTLPTPYSPLPALHSPLSAYIYLFAWLILFLSPLIIYFLFNPADFAARSTTVSIFNPTWHNGDLVGTVWRTLTTTLSTFVGLNGDANPLVNLPGQPALSVWLSPFFLLGLITSLIYSIRAFSPVPPPPRSCAPSPYLFLLCWGTVMLLPAILAPEGAPHHLRLIGTLVPAHIFVAIGLVVATHVLIRLISHSPISNTQRAQCLQFPSIAYLLPATCYLLVTLQTYSNYFSHWPLRVDFTLPFDLYAMHLAGDIAQAPPDVGYVLPMDIRAGREARHYSLDYLLARQQPSAYTYLPVDEHNAETILVQAAAEKENLHLVRWKQDKHREADAKEIVTYLLEINADLQERKSFPVYDVEIYALQPNKMANLKLDSGSAFQLPSMNRSINATFGGMLRIEAAFVPVVASSGAWLPIALTVAPLSPMDVDYKASIRLISPTGGRIAQKDRLLLHNFHQGTSLWPAETVNEYYLLLVPSKIPSGNYTVAVVFYDPNTQAPLLADGLVEIPLGQVRIG